MALPVFLGGLHLFAKIVNPLIDLLKSVRSFEWTSRQEACFGEIKLKFEEEPILGIFNSNASRTELYTDASSEGLGAMLLQTNDQNLLHLFSRQTSENRAV